MFSVSENVSGQNYISFPDSNAVWCGQRGQLNFNPPNDQWHTWTYQQYITGDTVINGFAYHKLEESGVFDWAAYPIPTSSGSSQYFHSYVGCFREDNKIIYYISPSGTVENYLYNFNLNVGDTLLSNILTPSNQTMITRIDSILISGNYRKQFYVSVVDTNLWQWPENFEYASYIEGIGSTNGLVWTLRPYFERSGSLWALKHNGVLEFTDSISNGCEVTGLEEIQQSLDRVNVYPNPTKNVLSIQTSFNGDLQLEIVDITGKIVKNKNILNSELNQISIEDLQDGIYVIKLSKNHELYKSVKFAVMK